MALTVETDPMETLKSLIDLYWKPTADFPKPEIGIVNDPEDAVARVDFSTGDHLLISQPFNEQIKQRGNFQYYDKALPLQIDLVTATDRQRLRNLWKMLRAILMDNKHNFSGYQLVKITSYQEMINTLNVWRGRIVIQVESGGVTSDTVS